MQRSTSWLGGGAGMEFADRAMQGCSGPRISSSRRVVLLRRCTRGQDGLRATGGEEIAAADRVCLNWTPEEIPAMQAQNWSVSGLGNSLGSRRSYCGGWQGLEGRGVAGLHLRRGGAVAVQGTTASRRRQHGEGAAAAEGAAASRRPASRRRAEEAPRGMAAVHRGSASWGRRGSRRGQGEAAERAGRRRRTIGAVHGRQK